MGAPDPIAVQMRAARRHRGWSLERMAAETGLDPMTIGSWERGDRQPGLAKTRAWLHHLGHELVALGPAGDSDGEVWTEYACRYPRPDADDGVGLIVCDTVEEAVAVAGCMIGAEVVWRRMRAMDWAVSR
jgi:transcriptional regulator with XRE-family HTH domain